VDSFILQQLGLKDPVARAKVVAGITSHVAKSVTILAFRVILSTSQA